MQKVIIDSCVFFRMIRYNDIYLQKGKPALEKVIHRRFTQLNELEERIKAIFPDAFKAKYGHLPFEEQLEQYKDYATNMVSTAERKLFSLEKNAQGIFFDKGRQYTMDIPEERRQKFLIMAEEQRKIIEKYAPTYAEYIKLKEKYKLDKLKIQAGIIFLQSINGNVDLHITSTIYDEVKNHIGEKTSERKGNLTFTQTQISNMTKNCTLINTHSENIVKLVEALSEQYRTPLEKNNGNYFPMDMDQNSLDIFGDSTIMAETSLSGINILTENEQDYIKHTGTKQKNSKIRNHISYVNQLYAPATSGALAYSPTEFLEGGYVEVDNQSKVVKLIEIDEQLKNTEFKNEVYMEI